MKICSKCKILKNLENFGPRKNVLDGRKDACRECLRLDNRKYYEQNKAKESERKRLAYQNNKDVILEKCREYRKSNKDEISKRRSQDRVENPEKYRKYGKNYRNKYPDYQSEYFKERRKRDPLFKLTSNIRTRIYQSLFYKKWQKNTKFSEYIGCDLNQLKDHLQSKFTEGMTWENYGKWHVDHVVCLSSAKTEEELYKLCHYTNLQPLWAVDNLRKGSK